MLDDLPVATDVTIVYRVTDATTATFRAELDAVAAAPAGASTTSKALVRCTR